jgi:hypothetical protein
MSIEHADLPIAAVQFHRESPGVPKERMITAMIEPDNWLTKARQGAPPCDPGRRERQRYRSDDQAGLKETRWLATSNGPDLAPGAMHSELTGKAADSVPATAAEGPTPRRRETARRPLSVGNRRRDEVQVLAVRRGSSSSFDRARFQSAAARGLGLVDHI